MMLKILNDRSVTGPAARLIGNPYIASLYTRVVLDGIRTGALMDLTAFRFKVPDDVSVG
jgi:hypothetical protein